MVPLMENGRVPGSVGTDVVLNVENCELPPCLLERGSTYNVNIQFTSSKSRHFSHIHGHKREYYELSPLSAI